MEGHDHQKEKSDLENPIIESQEHLKEHVHWNDLTLLQKVWHFLHYHKKIFLMIFFPLFIFIITFFIIYFSSLKYPVLGLVFKSEIEIDVSDAKTKNPLEGASVVIDNQNLKTDIDGKARIKNLKPGKKAIKVTKADYIDYQNTISLNFGVNDKQDVLLKATDEFYYLSILNPITNKFIKNETVEVDGQKYKIDDNGDIKLLRQSKDNEVIDVKVDIAGYNLVEQKVKIDKSIATFIVKVTPKGKNYFTSNRNGQFDLFKSNLDGTNQEVILKATGNEDANTFISVSPDNKWVALSSTREGIRGVYKYLIPQLYIFNTESESLVKLKTDQYFNIIGWYNGSIIYTSDSGTNDESRIVKLVSFDLSTKKESVITAGKYVYARVLNDYIVYSTFDYNNLKDDANGLYYIKFGDKNTKNVIYKGIINQVTSENDNKITFSSQESDSWFNYSLESKKLDKLTGIPPLLEDKELYVSPDKTMGTFIQNRDGKSELYLTDFKTNKTKRLTNFGTVLSPVRWIDNKYIIFHSVRPNETADYITSIENGDPLKIVDVYDPAPMHYQ